MAACKKARSVGGRIPTSADHAQSAGSSYTGMSINDGIHGKRSAALEISFDHSKRARRMVSDNIPSQQKQPSECDSGEDEVFHESDDLDKGNCDISMSSSAKEKGKTLHSSNIKKMYASLHFHYLF
jgi:hypothetical protein